MPARTKSAQAARVGVWLVIGVWCVSMFAGVLALILGDAGVGTVLLVVGVVIAEGVAGVRLQRWLLDEPCLAWAEACDVGRWWCCRCYMRAVRRGLERPEPVPLVILTCPRCGHERCSDA